MEALTPASPDSLPPVGDLIADEPFWRYRAGASGRALPTSAGGSPRILSPATWPVVTETGTASGITEPAEHIWAALARRYGPSLVLPEHHPAPQTGERGQILDLVRRCRRQPALHARVAGSAAESPPCQARAVDGRPRVPDHQQAGEPVRLVRG